MIEIGLKWVLLSGILLLLLVTAVLRWAWARAGAKQAPLSSDVAGDDLPFGILHLKGKREYTYANAVAREMLNLPPAPGELPERDWAQALTLDRDMARVEGSARQRTTTLADGRTVQWWVHAGEGRDTVLLWDITEQQRAQEAVHLLLSTLGHELRTPVASMRTHIQILQLAPEDSATREEALRVLREESAHLARLIDGLLDLGRLQTTAHLDLHPLDLLPLVRRVVNALRPLARERGITLTVEADAPLPRVLADESRLAQVFTNLVHNGIVYSRPGDRVTVSLRRGERHVLCLVEDTGPGIPAEHLPHLTRPFYRVQGEHTSGTGLGLAIAAEIVRKHGSRLHIESRSRGENTGTRITFSLRTLVPGEDQP